MIGKPLVSVIVPVYNIEKYVDALKAQLMQYIEQNNNIMLN